MLQLQEMLRLRFKQYSRDHSSISAKVANLLSQQLEVISLNIQVEDKDERGIQTILTRNGVP